MKINYIPLIIGSLIAVAVSTICFQFFKYLGSPELKATNNPFMESLEIFDLRFNDGKYNLRNDYESSAPVALIAIDEESLHAIGRWPWSRELVAEMTDRLVNLGAKSVAFDAIFAEPETSNPEADKKFGKVLTEHGNNIILGTFSENNTPYKPYQDLCVAEAFLRNGGDQLVKINPSFSIDETSTPFDEINWSQYFNSIFSEVEKKQSARFLATFNKTSENDLTQFQKNSLASQKSEEAFNYCRRWLTDQDELVQPENKEQAKQLFQLITADKPELQQLPIEELIQQIKNSYKTHPVPEYGKWTSNVPEIQVPAPFTASFVAQLDSDGYVRRYPLFYRSGNKLGSSFIPSLALQSYLLSGPLRAELKMQTQKNGEKTIQEFNIYDTSAEKEVKIATYPVDSAGQILINYYGKQMALPYVSAKDILSEEPTLRVMRRDFTTKGRQINFKSEVVNKKEFLKDRSLIVAATAVGIYDLRNTPIDPNYPGAELHLTTLANMYEQNFLTTWKAESKFLPWILLVIGLVFSFIWAESGAIPSLMIFIGLVGVIGSLDYWIFMHKKIMLHSLFVYSDILLIFAVIQLYKYFIEERKKRELKSTFSKYVSPAVVDELLKDTENLKLGGKKEFMTVFFSDVRGFTTISEKLTPEELSRVLNLYLTPMTEIVFQNKGTLDKYMGDAIMAFFGAPVKSNHHAADACRCALKSLEKLKLLQKQFEQQKLPHIDIGIGINTGEMSVGNMGSNIVQNYTVMGDSVNLASRLEGINKEYGTKIIISEFTYEQVRKNFTAREVDRVKVKGKLEPVRIFELVCEGTPDEATKSKLDQFNEAYNLYMGKKFSEALVIFENLCKGEIKDPPSELYIERCTDYIANPPPEDWDGVCVMKTK